MFASGKDENNVIILSQTINEDEHFYMIIANFSLLTLLNIQTLLGTPASFLMTDERKGEN